MKGAVMIIAAAGILLLLIALFVGYSQAQSRERMKETVIITHALTEWSLARQERSRAKAW